MPSLGRVLHPPVDHRDSLHPFSALLPPAVIRPRYKYWVRGKTRVDQDGVGACVSFAGQNWRQSSPTRSVATNAAGFRDYQRCKMIDGIPNVEGTYARALMKVYEELGIVERYLWAFNLDQALDWLATVGPILIGVNWYEDFFNPPSSAVLHIGGNVAGGHEVEVDGVNFQEGLVRFQNSWGAEWSQHGQAWLRIEDLERLLFREGGDCVTAIEMPF